MWRVWAACAAVAAGAFLGIAIDPVLAACAACCAAAAAAAAWLLQRRAVVPLLCCAAGLLRGAAAERPEFDPRIDAALADPTLDRGGREAVLVQGTIESTAGRPGGISAVVRLERAEARPGDAPLPSHSRILLWAPAAELARGDRMRAYARLHELERPLNPGEPERDLSLRAIAYRASTDDPPVVLARGPPLWRAIARLRTRFVRRCEDLCATRARAGLVAALGVGDRSLIAPDEDEVLSRSGLVHLLSSAGLHLAAVAAVVRFCARRVWLRGPWASRVRAAAVASACALPPIVAEVLVLGAPWPAVRAGIGATLALAASMLGRRGDGLTTLAFAIAACALVDPASTHDVALQLSAAGVFGLIVLAGPLRELIPIGPLPRPAEHLLRLACATAAATLCTAPLIAAHFHRVSLVSVAANTVGLVPGLAAIPIASFAAPLDAIAPTIALPLFWAADLLAAATVWAAGAFAAIPVATIETPAPSVVAAVLFWVGAILLARLPGSRAPPMRTRLLRAAIPFAAFACVAAAGAAKARWSDELSVTFLAVGQGDAAVVRLPGGRALLVDAGGDLRGDEGSRAGRIVAAALAELRVPRIDLAILTHPHPDHGGGFFAVFDRVPVRELWTTGESGPNHLGDRVRAAAAQHGARVVVPAAGAYEQPHGVRLEVLRSRFDPRRGPNDNSLVVRVVFGEVAILLAGDVEALAEAELAQSGSDLRAEVLKAGHHGSATSSTEAFLSHVRPSHVVYSVGLRNPFGFPSPDVAARAHAAGATVWRTDRGAVTATTDGRTLHLEQFSR
jgi:competence protein ComEC